MAIVCLFTYQWPSYMCHADVGLDNENGQAYDLLYVPTYGAYGSKLDQKTPITYDEVRRKARIAHDAGIADNAVKIVNPSDYDSLSVDSWRDFVRNPPSRVWNQAVKT